jgi:hypothetical protein
MHLTHSGSRNRPVDALCVVLEMRLILERLPTDIAPDPISLFDVRQVLPFEVLC